LKEGFQENQTHAETFLNLKYEGSDSTIMIRTPEDGDYAEAFHRQHSKEYGFNFKDRRKIIIENIRVRSLGRPNTSHHHSVPFHDPELSKRLKSHKPIEFTETYLEV
jgi:5-oxoprolinase (ATP-hydrolysing)